MPSRKSKAATDILPYLINRINAQDVPALNFGQGDAVMLLGTSEFTYDTNIIMNSLGKPFNAIYEWLAKDRNGIYPVPASNPTVGLEKSDFIYMVEQDLVKLGVKRVVFWVNVYSTLQGSGAYSTNLYRCRPALSKNVKDVLAAPGDWSAGGFTSGNAVPNPTAANQCFLFPGTGEGLPMPSGTPSDESLKRAMLYLSARGYEIGFALIPQFIDFSSTSFNVWRGDIGRNNSYHGLVGANPLATSVSPSATPGWQNDTGDPDDRHNESKGDDGFFANPSSPGLFHPSMRYNLLAWHDEYRAMLRHYANMIAFLGISPWVFYIGSEMRAFETEFNVLRETFIDNTWLAAKDVVYYLGHKPIIAHAVDWSNWHFMNNRFNLDQIFSAYWAQRVCLDWYQPIADQHTNSRCLLADGILGGENFDRYFPLIAPPSYRYLNGGGFGDPSPGTGKLELEPGNTMNVAYGSKNVQGDLTGVHVEDAAAGITFPIDPGWKDPLDPLDTRPPVPVGSAIVALVSPFEGLRLKEFNYTYSLGGQTLSNMVGTHAIRNDLDSNQKNVGTGVRTIPPLLRTWIPLSEHDGGIGGTEHFYNYQYRLPTYTRPYHLDMTGVNDVPYLPRPGTGGYQPGFAGRVDFEESGTHWPAYHAVNVRNVNYVFDIVFEFKGFGFNDERQTIAWHTGGYNDAVDKDKPGGGLAGSSIFRISTHASMRDTRYYLNVDVWSSRGDPTGDARDPSTTYGSPYTDVQFELEPDHIYRVQLYVDAVEHEPHRDPRVAELRVWDLTRGGDLVFNHANMLEANLIVPSGGSTVYLGYEYDADGNVRNRARGRVFYVAHYEKHENRWGGIFGFEEPYFGPFTVGDTADATSVTVKSRRTSWRPNSKPLMMTEFGFSKFQGSCVEPNVFVTTIQGTFNIPATHADYGFWKTMEAYFPDNQSISDIGGPYGSTMEADETHQATNIAATLDAFHQLSIQGVEGPFNAVAEMVLYCLDTRTRDTRLAPGDGAGQTYMYFEDGPRTVKYGHDINGTIAVKQGRSGGFPATPVLPPSYVPPGTSRTGSNASVVSSTVPGSASVAAAGQETEEERAKLFFWKGI